MKLNLGSGQNKLDGFINVDKFERFAPDVVWDLEHTPYPFVQENSVDYIVAHHVLEHLGQSVEVFFAIMKELFRVMQPDGILDIIVPPGHGQRFTADPTHVRPLYPQTFELFSKKLCTHWREQGLANSPLAEYLNIDFEITDVMIDLDEPWKQQYQDGAKDEVNFAIAHYNDVYTQVRIILKKVQHIVYGDEMN